MRVNTAMGFAQEVGPQQYAANAYTRAMTEPEIGAMVRSCRTSMPLLIGTLS